MEIELLKEKGQDTKGKAMTSLDDPDHDDIQTNRTIPKIRGLKRALQQQKLEAENVTFEERIAKEIEDDRETWLDRVDLHLGKLLNKVKKYNNILRNISNRYITRNNICNIKLKQLEEKHKQTLIKKKE